MKKYWKSTKKILLISAVLLLVLLLSAVGFFLGNEQTMYVANDSIAVAEINNQSIQTTSSNSVLPDLSTYKSKIYDSSKSINDYIPASLFVNECEQQFVGEHYGFFIKTTKYLQTYTSKVLLFEIERENVGANNIYKYTVKPVLDEIYSTTDGIHIKETNRSTYLVMSNLQYYANLINTHEGNTTENYDKTKDNGYFIHGAYTEGKYMLLEEDNPYVGMVSSAASFIFSEILDVIPGASLILGIMDLVGETTDWQSMNTINNRPHVHYGDYNTQLANKFNRQVILRDGANEPRYIAAKEEQEISFVIEYDNKNRNDVEAEIRNLLSFDVYEFTKEGYPNFGEVKLNSHNNYENMTISSFNDLALTAIEDRYVSQDNGVIFNDFYTQVYVEKNQTKQVVFTPNVSGVYSIDSTVPIKCYDGDNELNNNSLLLSKGTQYILSITNSTYSDRLCYFNVVLDQTLNLETNNDLVEGINLMPIVSNNVNATIYSVDSVNPNLSMLVLDENMQILNSSSVVNSELLINYLFNTGNYYIAIKNTGSSIVENVDLSSKNEERIIINQSFSQYISDNTEFFVKLTTEYTALYKNVFSADVQIIEVVENTFRPVADFMLFNSDKTYFLKFTGEGEQVSFKMQYTGKDVSHGTNTLADAFVNNIYEFDCNLTANYQISGIENYIVIDKETYSTVNVNNNTVQLQSGKSYFIIDENINTGVNNVKIEIIHQSIGLGVKTSNSADTYYKLESNYNGIIDIYPNNSIAMYNSDLQKVTSYNITNSDNYYIFVDSTINEIMITPQVVDINLGNELSLGSANFFRFNCQSSSEIRLTISNTDGNNYSLVIYDSNFNAVLNNVYSSDSYYKDIFYIFSTGQYYIGIYNINNGAKFVIENKTMITNINDSINVITNSERPLYYTLNINKSSTYNFDTNAQVTIQGETIDANGNVSLTAGTYFLEIKGLTTIPMSCYLNITINAEERGLMAFNQIFDNNTIYELTDFSSGSYEFLALGQYRIYDQNLSEIEFNNEVVFNTDNQYYIELVGGGVAYYKFINKHAALTTQGTTINLRANKKYYYAFDNVNMNFLAIACNNPNVIITVYNDLGDCSESVIATGTGLVFAYSENNIRYVSFQSNSNIDSATINLVDPKANVSNEIYWEQAMDIGQSYFKFTAHANGTYNISCDGSCSTIEVYDDSNIKMSTYNFEKGRTYTIKHNSTANHTVKVELNVIDLDLNTKNTVALATGNNYFEIDINTNHRVFSPTHNLNIYQTKHLDAPIITVNQNSVGSVTVFSSSSKRIIEVINNSSTNCILYVWKDLEENGVMNYSIVDGTEIAVGSNIRMDVRQRAVFTLPNLYDSIDEFAISYTYTPSIIKGTKTIETDIALQVRLNNRIVDQITKTIKFEIIGTPDSVMLSIINHKTKYNGFDTFNYSVVMKSGEYIVSGYEYTVSQVGGNSETNINNKTNTVSFNQDKDLYGKSYRLIANCNGVNSNEIVANVQVDQVVSFSGWYREDLPLDANKKVQLGINANTQSLRIELQNIQSHSWVGLVEWNFEIPQQIEYVEFIGSDNLLQFISIHLKGDSIVKIKDFSFSGITAGIKALNNTTLMIEGEVIIWGNSLLSLYQEYPGIDINGTLKLILLNGGRLNVKGGMGAWGADGINGSHGAKGYDGWAGTDGGTGGNGTDGTNGHEGGRGGVGIKANKIILMQYGNNDLMIEGGMGGQGGNGGDGGNGGQGGADTSWWLCGPGKGGNGGHGGNGGDGGFGGYALECNDHNIPSIYLVNHNTERSEGGSQGNGGAAGAGGNAGDSGKPGKEGEPGNDGEEGTSGTYGFNEYSNERFGVM